ncbi:MAG: hypothetical protein GC190_07395 [Alphaproteobacteria bacterium]|nr:hypothetical protein [Alphaproteobacteria bacterium]
MTLRKTTGRAFVISPIGAEGSPQREHADDVFEFIIEPALKQAGVTPYRADHDAKSGRISHQMVASILEEDFCIAVLTGHNPNVFYELAIAQCAARPVILLIDKSEEIPFDVHDLRVIRYDFNLRAIRDGVYVRQIVEQIESIRNADGNWHVPFAPDLSPLGVGTTHVQCYPTLDEYIQDVEWRALVDKASVALDLVGLSLSPLSKVENMSDRLRAAAARGTKIRVMVGHPDNPWVPLYAEKSRSNARKERFTDSLSLARKYFVDVAQKAPRMEVRPVQHGAILQLLVANEHEALAVPHLFDTMTYSAPTLVATASSSIYKTWRREFEVLWNQNNPVTT